jgi:predicted amino acid-binding ACT domain protein
MSFTMETKRLPKALLAELEQIADVTPEDKQAIICLVGEDIHGKPGIAASVFNTVAESGVNIRMISQGASEINISFVVQESDVPKAVRHLHEHFFPAGEQVKVGKTKVKTNGSPRRPQTREATIRRSERRPSVVRLRSSERKAAGAS